jgi:hypothetical protein
VTDAEWLTANRNLWATLDALDRAKSERKLQLFGAYCGRRIWSHLTDDGGHQAVESCELSGDQACGVRIKYDAAKKLADTIKRSSIFRYRPADVSAWMSDLSDRDEILWDVFQHYHLGMVAFFIASYSSTVVLLAAAKAGATIEEARRRRKAERDAQESALRDLLGNKSHPPTAEDRLARIYHSGGTIPSLPEAGSVRHLAQAIYNE